MKDQKFQKKNCETNLRNDCNRGSVPTKIPLRNIFPVHQNPSFDGFQKPENGENERRLSGSGSSDDSDLLTRTHVEADFPECDVTANRISRSHFLESDLAETKSKRKRKMSKMKRML